MGKIVVTGVAGFIGSYLSSVLLEREEKPIVGVDDFGRLDKNRNLVGKNFDELVHRNHFIEWLDQNGKEVDVVFHIGARTDTAEKDESIFEELNVAYTKDVWNLCSKFEIPLIYASSAATYGIGEAGYDDDHSQIAALQPLNPYGWSKQLFDQWALEQGQSPPHWYGFKFFNVYGPNEYHKGRMASVILHAFNQISATGKMKLFKSHKEGIENGFQSRDFIYVRDLIDVLLWTYETLPDNGIYNLGTGTARPFLHLAEGVFKALDKDPEIEYIDTPVDIRDTYQYFTEANMDKLKRAGYDRQFTSLENGIQDYVTNYLLEGNYR